MQRAVLTWSLFASLLVVGLVLIGISVPTLLSKVPPNGMYGFRTAHTMSDPKIWYAANVVASRYTIACGAIMLLLATGLPFVSRIRSLSNRQIAYVGLVFEIVPPVLLVMALLLYDRTL